jgi:hypothetical protein
MELVRRKTLPQGLLGHPHAPGEILGHVPDVQFDSLVHQRRAVFAQFLQRHFVIERISQRRTGLILTHQQVERFGPAFCLEGLTDLVHDYHSAIQKFDDVVVQQLNGLYNWMFVPTTLWLFNVQDVLEDCLTALERGKPLNSRHRLLI